MSDTLRSSSKDSPMAWFRAKQRELTIAGAALLGVGAVGGLLYWMQVRKEAAASALLEQARNTADTPSGFGAAASQLQRIIDQFGGTNASQEAVLTLAQIRIINGQNQLAVAALQEFIADGPRAQYRSPAYGLLGGAQEGVGQYAEAATSYSEASAAADLDPLAAQYLIHAARAYELAGDREKSLAALRRVVTEYKDSPFKTEATIRLAESTKGAEPVATH
jgi:predicted negative regulator of RcsB-dependent stress response